jgi:hypothetical protein
VKSNADRANKLSYQIPIQNAAAASLTIEAKEVISTVQGCTIETTAEWYNGLTGQWEKLRSNSFLTTDFATSEMTAEFSGDQV